MEHSSTFLSEDTLKTIIQASGSEIRSFLSFINDPQDSSIYSSLANKEALLENLSDDMRSSAQDFAENPQNYSDEHMLKKGEGIIEAIKNFIRIEVRGIEGVHGAAQVVSKGIEGDFRTTALESLRKNAGLSPDDVMLKFAGRSSIEFNVSGVNKSLPFKYLRHHFDEVLDTMNYSKGTQIDARSSKTILAADGDSTIYGGPLLTGLPTLSESPVHQPLNEFLRLGGVFLLISGNNLERTSARIFDGIDPDLRCRCLLVANGAASMAVYDASGQLKEIEDYRLNALKHKDESNKDCNLDVVYIGDDGHPNGNDIDGFREVGFERSFLVEKEGLDFIEEGLKDHHVPGEEKATGTLLSIIVDLLSKNNALPFFTQETIGEITSLALR